MNFWYQYTLIPKPLLPFRVNFVTGSLKLKKQLESRMREKKNYVSPMLILCDFLGLSTFFKYFVISTVKHFLLFAVPRRHCDPQRRNKLHSQPEGHLPS